MPRADQAPFLAYGDHELDRGVDAIGMLLRSVSSSRHPAIPDLSSAPRIVDPSVRITPSSPMMGCDPRVGAGGVHVRRDHHRVVARAREHGDEVADLVLVTSQPRSPKRASSSFPMASSWPVGLSIATSSKNVRTSRSRSTASAVVNVPPDTCVDRSFLLRQSAPRGRPRSAGDRILPPRVDVVEQCSTRSLARSLDRRNGRRR